MNIILLFCLAFHVSHINIQDNYPLATLSSDYGIQIDMDSPLSEVYEIDYKSMGWSSSHASETLSFLNDFSKYLSFEMKGEKLIMILDLNHAETQTWDLVKWNSYLKTIR